jgi:hypothetical protein
MKDVEAESKLARLQEMMHKIKLSSGWSCKHIPSAQESQSVTTNKSAALK